MGWGINCKMKLAEPIKLSLEERSVLKKWAGGRSFSFRLVQRAQIIRMAADEMLSQDIAQKLRVSRPMRFPRFSGQ